MPKYIVKDTHIKHGVEKTATEYAPGDEIELTEAQAAALGSNVKPAADRKAAELKKEANTGKGK